MKGLERRLGQKSATKVQQGKVDWAESGRMQVFTTKARNERWTPLWANDDRKIRLVVYGAVWRFIKRTGGAFQLLPGMSLLDLEGLAKERFAVWHDVMERTTHENYRSRLKTYLTSTEHGYAARAVAIIYKCYRENLRAPDVAEQLGITAVSVRQILYRLNNVARELFKEEDGFKRHWSARGGEDKEKRNARSRRDLHSACEANAPLLWKEIARFYNSGATLKELEPIYRVKGGTIHAALKRFKLLTGKRHNRGSFVKDYFRTKGTDFNV